MNTSIRISSASPRGISRLCWPTPSFICSRLTSGTTATRKFIPVTPGYLADYKRGWNLWGLKVFRDHPERFALRPILQMSGDWQEFTTPKPRHSLWQRHGTDTASMQLAHHPNGFIACREPVGKVKDPTAKYYIALRLSLPRRVGMIIAANPSTLVNMARRPAIVKRKV